MFKTENMIEEMENEHIKLGGSILFSMPTTGKMCFLYALLMSGADIGEKLSEKVFRTYRKKDYPDLSLIDEIISDLKR